MLHDPALTIMPNAIWRIDAMRKITVVMTLTIFAAFSQVPTFSQESSLARFGIGVDFGGIKNFFFGSGSSVYLPINLSSKFRVEPLIAVIFSDSEEKREITTFGYSGTLDESSLMYVDLGVGLFMMSEMNKLRLYYGTRQGYLRISSLDEEKKTREKDSWETTGKRKEVQNGFYVGPAVGGEYALSTKLTLGGEAHVAYSFLDGKVENRLIGNSDVSQSSVSTRGLAFIRFYF